MTLTTSNVFSDRPPDLDLGSDHYLWFYQWAPDRDLNPQYKDHPDIEKAGAVISHPRLDTGAPCWSAITFDSPAMRAIRSDDHFWQVQSWEPLTLTPSLLCVPGKTGCGDHGFITNGKWVKA